ncbi:MAG TPA: hypothetical protein VG474_06670, partial [Solirubrobacteraceae bacterium]|nr:hypothetical protein [Solirubrobacteraceae bacterium]
MSALGIALGSLAACAALALAAPAAAQLRLVPAPVEVQPPPPAPAPASPEPLWVPDPEPHAASGEAAADVAAADPLAGASTANVDWAADDRSRVAIAHWMADAAVSAGLPAELPVMAALVESNLRNLPYGDRDSVGYFQMRLGIWNRGAYEGYLARPELQLRWFVDRALAVQRARVAAGDETYGSDPGTWGDWIADVERPAGRYRGRYAQRLAEARALLAAPAAALAPFELALTVGGPAHGLAPAGELAERVLADRRITLDPRARGDLAAGRVDPRLCAVLLHAAERAPIAVTVLQTGHSYRTVHGTISNHSFGRGADIGAVGGTPVRAGNAAARELALALGALPADVRPTEIGTPWAIDDPAYFTDGDHRDHLHVGFDEPLGADAGSDGPRAATSPSPV